MNENVDDNEPRQAKNAGGDAVQSDRSPVSRVPFSGKATARGLRIRQNPHRGR
ncbi:hypothetical protein OZX57_00035 [Bifidobacterium sp. ESL0682]|uniref:hypothetical protein n=1 Tax=Bifidobacterium sp. ESL0682 TaxID=2983212 RepID=UPI0023F8623A|nr:hypothetical protein [Bifidobacterium sp. ESL0682]WEV41978.1 hypothetical protein OZX57_00035 [Bifidobacterium sp. ESL0682]